MSTSVDPLPLPPPLFGSSTTLVAAVTGINKDSGAAVSGTSAQFDAVVGATNSPAHAGVTGRNQTTGADGGVGIYGVGGKYAGKFDGDVLMSGVATATSLAVSLDTHVHRNLIVDGSCLFPTISVGGPASTAVAIQGTSQTQDAIRGTSAAATHAGVSAVNTGGGFGLWAQARTAGYFGGDVHVTGTINVDGDVVFAEKAADCAEQFDLASVAAIEPGTVMVITANGELATSEHPYDRKVAGVVSGAGGFRPAMILDKQDSDRATASVALIGKVYCKVDAEYGPIEVGDLLTTSPSAGRAMKASDAARAFGSVIGKALGSMPSGQGLIPVLIALQ